MPLWVWALALLVVSTAIQAILVKPQKVKPASLEDFDFPQFEENTPQAVFFGDCWTEGWMILWFGDMRTEKIKSEGGKK